ncbi:MAG: anhydro-N-acetylmuramic acid kinase [Pseudomonadota bacterium]
MRKEEPVWALGTMSGTSLDGVDAAMVLTDGRTLLDFGRTGYAPYSQSDRDVISHAFGQRTGASVDAAAHVVETAHVSLLETFPDADLVGFHGQTLTHLPDDGVTVQAGNGDVVSNALGRPVIWDFRSADMTLGGQGAPLAPFFHWALAQYINASQPLCFLNLGGVGNLTWVDPTVPRPEQDGACLAFDTGPGNALIDDLCHRRRGAPFDKDGALAASGTIDQAVLNGMLKARYFSKLPPKSLDRNDFSTWAESVEPLSDEDAAATLAAGSAASVAIAFEHLPSPPARVLVAGGGRHNAELMAQLVARLPCPVHPVEHVGLNGDMLEAQAFAYLAVRVLHGLPTSAPGTTGVAAPVGGGKISRPRKT